MKLTKDIVKFIIEDINDRNKRRLREQDFERWMIYNGQMKESVKNALAKEFGKPETVEAMLARLVPINIVPKIIDKLAGVYIENPVRKLSDENEADTELLEAYEDGMNINVRMKEANRYYRLFKRNLMEILVDERGKPCVRNLPRHTYEVYAIDTKTPEVPNVVAKILKDSMNTAEQEIEIWTDESYLLVDGDGQVIVDDMLKLGNRDGSNPYETLPFVYVSESSHSVVPIPDDDLISVAVAVPIVLTDLLFACKYQCWSIIYTIGGGEGDIPMNPNSVVNMEYDPNGNKPEIGTVKPNVDSDKVLTLVQSILAALLSTRNLSVTTIQTGVSVSDAVSGISKMMDNAESLQSNKDQQAIFYRAEEEFWDKLINNMIPVWRGANALKAKFNKEFSQGAEVFVVFREPKVVLSEKETVELAILKLENGLSTKEIELAKLNPDYGDEEINFLVASIKKEKEEKVREMMENMQEQSDEVPEVDE